MQPTEILLVIISLLLSMAPVPMQGLPAICSLPSSAMSAGLAGGRMRSRQMRLAVDCSTFRYRKGKGPERNLYSIRSLTDPESPILRQSKEEMELDLEDHYDEIRKLHDRFLATRDRLDGVSPQSYRLSKKKKKMRKSSKSGKNTATKETIAFPEISEAELLQLVSALSVNHEAWGIPKWEYYLLITELMDFATINNYFQGASMVLAEFALDTQLYEAIRGLTAFGCFNQDCPGVIARTFRSWYHFYGGQQRRLIATAMKNVLSNVSEQDPENAARMVRAFTQLRPNPDEETGQYFRMLMELQIQELVEMSLNAITLLIKGWDYVGRNQVSLTMYKELNAMGIFLRWEIVEKEWKLIWTFPSASVPFPAMKIPVTCEMYDLETKQEQSCTIPFLMDAELAENWYEYLHQRFASSDGHLSLASMEDD